MTLLIEWMHALSIVAVIAALAHMALAFKNYF